MFLDYYQLREQPFGVASDPPYVYAGHAHSEVLDSFTHSLLNDRGNLMLVAEPGMGKTTLLGRLSETLAAKGRTVIAFQKDCTICQLLQSLLTHLGVDSAGMEPAVMLNKLNEIWFAELLAGKRFVLLFDDAEELDDEVFATLRQISKYETSKTKLLQIVLSSQPQFSERLEREELKPLCKGIAGVKRLETLSPLETSAYVRKRLHAAGYRGEPIFDAEAMAVVAECSKGIPGNINKICSRALLEAYARGLRAVSAEIVEKAARNLNVAAIAAAAAAGSSVSTPRPTGSGVVPPYGGMRNSPQMFRTPIKFSLPASGLWAGVLVGVLLSAGLALPHGMLRGMTHVMHSQESRARAQTLRHNDLATSLHSAPPSVAAPMQSPVTAKHNLTVETVTQEASVSLPEIRENQASQPSLTRELGLKINRIVIDPGHGGFDTGAKGPRGLMEKDVCLDVALRLGKLIEENISGAEVIYTRKNDSYVPLEQRTAIANNADADLFISIHANSSDSREVRGVETYYLSLATSKEAKELAIRENALTQSSLHDLPELVQKITRNEKTAESRLLAIEIQDILSERLQLVSHREKNRGVKQAPFIVLTGANMPAVLSEISFVSNANDETLLLGNNQRERIAEGLYYGIAAYLDGLNGAPEAREKLVTENRTNTLSSLDRTAAQTAR